MAHALRIKVSPPAPDSEYCPAVITMDDGSEIDTPIVTFSELRERRPAMGSARAALSPATIAWLKDRDGWPPDTETVGKI